MLTRRLRAALVLAAVPLLTPLLMMPAAHAENAPLPLRYSLDGRHWTSVPPSSLFPAGWRPVPGAAIRATLYLRSTRSERTIVGVYAGPASASAAALLAHTSLTGDGHRVPLSSHPGCALVVRQRVLAHGDTMAVPLTLAVDPALTSARGATLNVDLELALSDTGVATLPGHCPVAPALVHAFPPPDSPSATLPDTGAPISPWLPLAGATAVVLGALTLAGPRLRRRR
jgi:hypothetical protein